jgi:hypothetical protein
MKQPLLLILKKIIHFFLTKGKKNTVEKIIKFFLVTLKKDNSKQYPLLYLIKKIYFSIVLIGLKKLIFRKFFVIVPHRLKKLSQINLFLMNFLMKKNLRLKKKILLELRNITNLKKLMTNLYQISLQNKYNLKKNK